MKYKDFSIGDEVKVIMPKGSGHLRPCIARILDKGADGVVLFENEKGKRWWANSRRIKQVVKV